MLDTLKAHSSDLIAIVGLGITIYYARGAKSAARAAMMAANQTRLRLGKIEAADLLKDCIFTSKTVIEKLESENWDLVSHNSTIVRRALVTLKHTADDLLEENHAEILDDAIIQFKILTGQADKVRMTDWKAYNKTTYISTIHEQVDALIAVQEHIRKKLGEEA